MTLSHRLGQLERRVPHAASPYCVVVHPGENEAEAIARTQPPRGYVIVPAQMTMEAWQAAAEKELSP